MQYKTIYLLLSCLLLTACSKINSVEPFDDKQANIIIKNIYIPEKPNKS